MAELTYVCLNCPRARRAPLESTDIDIRRISPPLRLSWAPWHPTLFLDCPMPCKKERVLLPVALYMLDIR